MTEIRCAVVTGAASGIGRAIAQLLAQRGWHVLAVDKDAAVEALADAWTTPLVADLTRASDCDRIPDAARAIGPLRGIVNCAGVELHGTVIDMPEADWDLVMATNLKSIFLVGRACLPLMEQAGGGAVVNIGSIQGMATQRSVAAYAATKGAIIALTRAMALDHAAQGIRVVCVCPGTIDTPLVRANAEYFTPGDPDRSLREWGALHALNRIGTTREVATAVAFMLSDDASFITGSSHLVDGGLLASF
ncbi:SDR family NAD(P)-dependent oxidoreductase [Conexibacter sp. CPCC 206217]|uniref:SDR family NAD(P)-dependent oxidoreductase n=1 Tax=Conexibacter sp. CPCC 206217 TaxID=3064574 RepID=UPI00271951AB|nr:SDR family oxidoreductase [Conexibacter sp. CPCC 206217]MDO8208785.1 SDR family oxidoreductase [Conexibacter sp. CPCC 206217]